VCRSAPGRDGNIPRGGRDPGQVTSPTVTREGYGTVGGTTGPCQTVTRGSGRHSGPRRDRIEERAPSKTVTARGVRDHGESVGSPTVTPGRDAPSAPFHEERAPSEAVTARGVRYRGESAVNRFEFTPIGGGAGTRPSRGTNGHRSHPLPRESLRGRGETVRLDRFPARDRGTATVARGFGRDPRGWYKSPDGYRE
jgi:hypothetical protein